MPNLLTIINERVPKYDGSILVKAEIVDDIDEDIPIYEETLIPDDEDDRD